MAEQLKRRFLGVIKPPKPIAEMDDVEFEAWTRESYDFFMKQMEASKAESASGEKPHPEAPSG